MAKKTVQVFTLDCECGQGIINPLTSSFDFVNGWDVPPVGTKLVCDACGKTHRVPKF